MSGRADTAAKYRSAYRQIVVRPWTIKQALPWNETVHRRLPVVTGGLWALRAENEGIVIGAAIVGHAQARAWNDTHLEVLRVAVRPGWANACTMLYGACSRAGKAMGALNMVTYVHEDEHGISLKAAGWIFDTSTKGGEWDRDGRQRNIAVDPKPKRRWYAPWSAALKERTAA